MVLVTEWILAERGTPFFLLPTASSVLASADTAEWGVCFATDLPILRVSGTSARIPLSPVPLDKVVFGLVAITFLCPRELAEHVLLEDLVDAFNFRFDSFRDFDFDLCLPLASG